MKYLTTGLIALLGLVVTGCSTSPSAACSDSLKITCEKIHECTEDKTTDADADGTADFIEMFGADAAECETMLDDGYTVDFGGTTITVDGAACADVDKDNVCPTATPNYDAGAAKECSDGYEGQTCAEYNDTATAVPSGCADVCTAD